MIEAIQEVATSGTAYGAPTELETRLAKRIIEAVPSIEMVRFVNSGTEATMTAIRLARGITGRQKVLKFSGGYHGHSDGLLAKAGSGIATLALPDSKGVPPAYAAQTLVTPYNDLDALNSVLELHAEDLAAIIVEPIAANMGVIEPSRTFLPNLRKAASETGALLIFDEIITGFRVHYGGAQTLLNVKPDLTCLGKIIGGGLPVGAIGASKIIMEQLAPLGPVYQAGTLSGNPLAMAAGIATLDTLGNPGTYEQLERAGNRLAIGLSQAAQEAEIDYSVTRIGSALTGFFRKTPPSHFDDAVDCNLESFSRFFHAGLENGLNLAPSQFEAMFVSLSHDDEIIDATIDIAQQGFAAINRA